MPKGSQFSREFYLFSAIGLSSCALGVAVTKKMRRILKGNGQFGLPWKVKQRRQCAFKVLYNIIEDAMVGYVKESHVCQGEAKGVKQMWQ
jgi:hypothetical protein